MREVAAAGVRSRAMITLLTDADVHAPQPLGVRHVLVAGGRVVWIGTELPTLDAALGVQTIRCEGRRLLPGLVDGHVHVTGGGGEGGFATSVPPPPLSAYTSNGVTSVVGLLGVDDLVRTPAQVLARVRALRAEGLHAWMLTGGYHHPVATVTGSVAGDLAHIEPVLGVGELALSDHRGSGISSFELVEVASAVRSAAMLTGKAGTLHLHLGDGKAGLDPLREAIATSDVPDRLWHPTHVNRSWDLLRDATELTRTSAVRIDVTAFPDDPNDEAPSAAEAIVSLLDAGVSAQQLTLSSDAGGSIPAFSADGTLTGLGVGDAAGLLTALRELVAYEVPLRDALSTVTSSPADQLGLPDVGRIAVGAHADLLLVDEQLQLTDVFVAGVHHVRDGQQVVRGTFEPGPPA